jgi:hypothetical protein
MLNRIAFVILSLIFVALFWAEGDKKRHDKSVGNYLKEKFDIPGGGKIYCFSDVVNGFQQMGYFAIDKDGKIIQLFHHP